MSYAHRRSLPSVQPLLDRVTTLVPELHISAYDGSASGASDSPVRVSIINPRAFVRIARAPRGLGLARAWVAGEISIEGDLLRLASRERSLWDMRLLARMLSIAVGTTLAVGYDEFRRAGCTEIEYRAMRPGRHSVRSDLHETNFHYSLSPDFYRLLLGPSLTYSCAMFNAHDESLEDAQARKHTTIIAKLGLDESSVVLDVGCGWGSFLLSAVQHAGCRGIGITASMTQLQVALQRIGKTDRIDIHCGDYRQILPVNGVSAAASVGMYEHVGEAKSTTFFTLLRRSLPRGARYLNQSIFRRSTGSAHFRANSFTQRYIFPNAQLLPLDRQLRDLEQSGFQIVSVQNYGASYAQTIHSWLRNLDEHHDACVALEGEPRVRAWQMYLSGALRRFEDRSIDLTQILAEAV